MKNTPLVKSALGLLVAAGASLPLAAVAASDDPYLLFFTDPSSAPTIHVAGIWNYDGAEVAERSTTAPSPDGLEGPIRSETMESAWSFEEGAAYDNLRQLHEPSPASLGAEGPVRSETMDAVDDSIPLP